MFGAVDLIVYRLSIFGSYDSLERNNDAAIMVFEMNSVGHSGIDGIVG